VAPVPEPPRIDVERVLTGRYRLHRLIARGGMAEVWEATDETLGRRVAVKVLLPHLAGDSSFLDRFRREAVAAARLAHPNVVETYDAGIDHGVAYIVMELVRGRTLREVLGAHGPLPPARAVRIASQVAAALDYAHHSGIVHRDVKPANILLADDDRVKVADFGIAKAAEGTSTPGGPGGQAGPHDLTQSGAVMGTAKYLSPEQVNGQAIDGRADVYALGVVLYEMLCGQAPFDGETDLAVALKHVSSTPLSPRQVRAGIPRPLEAVVLRAMAKVPGDRYPSAGDLQSALLSIDLGPDDAVALVTRDPTPPDGMRAVSFRQTEQSWMWPTVLILVVAVTLGLLGVLFATTDTGQRFLNLDEDGPGGEPTETTAQAQAIRRTLLFDPDGDGTEHDAELPLLHDGDPSTTWSTHEYSTRRFGGLKPGVGVVAELGRAQALRELAVVSPSRRWDVEVYVADSARPTLAGWGQPVATRAGVDGETTSFDLQGRTGGAVLVWITDLGPDVPHQVIIGELRLRA
jgi:serine/threonine-protein kinase